MSHSPSRHQVDKHYKRLAEEHAQRQAAHDVGVVAGARRVVAAWNARIAAKKPADFFPAIGTAIASGHHRLNYWCPACQQINALDLRSIAEAHHPRAPISVLIPKLSCKVCCPNPPLAVLLDLESPADEYAYTATPLADFPDGMVCIICTRCGRRGHYRKTTLLERYGPAIVGPDLLRQVAKCDRQNSINHPCGAHYE